MTMRNARVPLFGNPMKSVTVNPAATAGAQVGVNLVGPDGRVVTPAMWKAMQGTANSAADSTGGTTDGIDEGAWNLYFTDERAQDAVGAILKNSANVTLAYDDNGPTIKADLIDVTVTAGGALKKYGFDAKGLLSESGDATTDDLTEGDNLYFTQARAAVAGMAPTLVAANDSFSVPENSQCLFTVPIDVEGALDVSGALVEVA